jgi:putative Mn2+ efflux pump MntP
MPMSGCFAGIYFADKIEGLDHWIAFILLGLSVATSIDARVAGVSFAFLRSIYNGGVNDRHNTCFIAMNGAIIGGIFGMKFKSKAEFTGGRFLSSLG